MYKTDLIFWVVPEFRKENDSDGVSVNQASQQCNCEMSESR